MQIGDYVGGGGVGVTYKPIEPKIYNVPYLTSNIYYEK